MARAPFIWTAAQPVDEAAARSVFTPLRREDGINRWFLFRRVVELPSRPTHASVDVTVDGRYRLFINGRPVGRGPARCQPLLQRFDTHDLSPWLERGTNVIGMMVHVYGVDTAWYETVKGQWNAAFGDGAVWLDGHAVCGDSHVPLQSDLQWQCLDCNAWRRDTPQSNQGLDFIECFDARRFPVDWLSAAFCAAAWSGVRALHLGGGGPEAHLSGMSVRPFPVLEPRGIPQLLEVEVAPTGLRWLRSVVACPELPIERRIFAEPFAAAAPGSNPSSTQPFPLHLTTDAGHGVALLLDFDRIHAGYPFIEVVAAGGELIDIACAERLPDESGRIQPDLEMGLGAHVTRYVARPGLQRFERFEWQAVRCMQITVHDAAAGLELRAAGCVESRYPVRLRGEFACSDPALERLWHVGATTVHLCMQDGWIDCPGRERRQWLGDATVESAVANIAFGPDSHALNAKFLIDAASSQRPDGLLQMFAPGDHGGYRVTIPDWTLQWILNAHAYWLWAGDVGTIERIWPGIERALQWFTAQIGPHHLVADMPYWHFMDWAGVGREGEACTLNAQLAGALDAGAQMSRALGNEGSARRMAGRADGIRAALALRHWDEARGVYVDGVDPGSGRPWPRVSQHANAAMVLWGGAPRARWQRLLGYVTDPARVKQTRAPPIVPDGARIDPQHDVVAANTFYSHFLGCALHRAGEVGLLLATLRSRYRTMMNAGATTLWETSEGTGSACHGFSATPTYQLSMAVLGLEPLQPGCAAMRWAPALGDLSFARGRVSTVRGDVGVQLERSGQGVMATLDVPAGMRVRTDASGPGAGREHEREMLGPGRFECIFREAPRSR